MKNDDVNDDNDNDNLTLFSAYCLLLTINISIIIVFLFQRDEVHSSVLSTFLSWLMTDPH